MSEVDAAARRLEARVGKRFVAILGTFVDWELKKKPTRRRRRAKQLKQTRKESAFSVRLQPIATR